MTGHHLLYITTPDRATALTIAADVVESRLAACANLWEGMTSVYRWEGEIREESETVLLLKTTRANVDALTARVVALHPYECPCVLALPVETGHPPFLNWMDKETL